MCSSSSFLWFSQLKTENSLPYPQQKDQETEFNEIFHKYSLQIIFFSFQIISFNDLQEPFGHSD